VDLAKNLGSQVLTFPEVQDPNPSITGISEDSREIRPGYLFGAVQGTKTHGRSFIPEALKRGAVAILTEDSPFLTQEYFGESLPVPVLMVPDDRLRFAISKSARAIYQEPDLNLTLVGITGTNGKTTITYLLEKIFEEQGIPVGVMGTINYRYQGQSFKSPNTTPEGPLLFRILKEMVESGVKVCILEVSSHGLALGRLGDAKFDCALFTNLTRDHLDFHETLVSYFTAKKLLFSEHLKAVSPSKPQAAINHDDASSSELFALLGDRALGFGFQAQETKADPLAGSALNPNPPCQGKDLELSREGVKFVAQTSRGEIFIQSQLLGAHNASNLLGVVALGEILDIPKEAISEGLRLVSAPPGRLERVGDSNYLCLVDYAHTPDAIRVALLTCREIAQKVIIVFGCGGNRDRTKRPFMAEEADLADIVIVTSDNPRDEDPYQIISDTLRGLTKTSKDYYDHQNQLIYPNYLTEITKKISSDTQASEPFAPLKAQPRPWHPGSPIQNVYAIEADRRQAIRLGVELLGPQDVLLVAGKGHEDYQIIKGQKFHLDDREIALQALRDFQKS
jgi:UDP-N-acetylmuramoyl-L-alanyl-D-glutamate--2,6-diaminopimelate ligase